MNGLNYSDTICQKLTAHKIYYYFMQDSATADIVSGYFWIVSGYFFLCHVFNLILGFITVISLSR
jgi:hypothetical protein